MVVPDEYVATELKNLEDILHGRPIHSRLHQTIASLPDHCGTMGDNDNLYHMIILLEEAMEADEPAEGSDEQETKKIHEFVEELVLPFTVDELDALNKWFDKFDEDICIPNEGHIKYEITSDGMMVLILDKEYEHLITNVRDFVEANSS
ncbi:hypothetical protein HG536_0H00680 [Torulaspora globosa]|uniref:Uncharacterized protein n=1 Tax=Torulaspora globosa TaxID=48254 RepID=A0A7G3ZMF7_9SACH|nr:uncharacterized protein HG536_0H00680 [Torulaspora globosa]QLL34693.1 hypothetical protein HG536_0H00680 [Torulaspora globosa]